MTFTYPNCKSIRDILFRIIQVPAAVNSYYNPQQIAEICNTAGGFNNEEALSNSEKDSSFTQELSDLFSDLNGSNVFIHMSVGKRFERWGARFTAAGVFDSESSLEEAERQLIADENRHFICQWRFDLVSDEVRDAFIVFAKVRSAKSKPKSAPEKR
jgi:hypothetical protein